MNKICDECETVAHCTKHGCIPKVLAKDAMKLALDHLMNLQPILGNGLLEERQLAFIDPHIDCAIAALQGGLAEQPAQQQPVLWLVNGVIQASDIPKEYTGCLFTSPQPSKPWVGLTDELENAFKDGWNAAKAAHGIKENT